MGTDLGSLLKITYTNYRTIQYNKWLPNKIVSYPLKISLSINTSATHTPVHFVVLVTQPCPVLCDTMGCSILVFPVLHCLPELPQIHAHCADAIQPSHPLSPPPPPALSLSQHQGFFQQVGFLHRVAKVLELQHQSFQWIFRVDFL